MSRDENNENHHTKGEKNHRKRFQPRLQSPSAQLAPPTGHNVYFIFPLSYSDIHVLELKSLESLPDP